MQLQFDYQMQLRYSLPAERCFYTLKCIPKDTERQRLLTKEVQITPSSPWTEGTDGWGNRKLYGCIAEPHQRFSFRICGTVESFPERYEALHGTAGMYRYPFGKSAPGPGICAFFRTLPLANCTGAPEKCLRILHSLHERFAYVRQQTSAETTAEQAWALGMGVCQDFSHIYAALLRLAGIPARYVCGLMAGEGESHAWVEALCDGQWLGLDPTNDCPADGSYIKLGDGRDASECAINRGILLGGGIQQQRVNAVVTPVKDK